MESEQKPKEIKIEISCEVRDKKWNELTLKEKGVEVFSGIWALSFFLLILLVGFVIPFTATINDFIVISIIAISVVWSISTIYLIACDYTFSEARHRYCNKKDWDS